VIQYNEDGTSILSYITTGGEIDVYFFLKASAKQIISQYQNLVGLPALPPFWALGWHAASYGYQTLADVDENVQGYKNESIPLEGVWLDIPYMDELADFSVNQTAFPDLKTYTQNLQAAGQKMVVIVDAGISADDITNKYFAQAATQDLLIKSSIHPDKFNGALSTTVWPNHTVFLDFLSPNATKIWEEGLKDLYDLVPYDGLWLDMNEICSFCDGECPDGLNTTNSTNSSSTHVGSDSWYISYADQGNDSTYFLPFIPGKDHLDFMTMSPNATHPSTNHSEFDVHSIFGMVETHRTRDFLVNSPNTPHPNKRPFMLTRSTFAGSGNNTAHWLGDNHREWAYMNYSIAGVMSFNMFGIPMVGPDTCGFFKSEDPQQVIDQY
jgi:alpha-glucosidase